MTYPGYSILALALIVVLALLAVGASVAVWRIRSMTGTAWIVFVSPVYVD